MNPLTSPYHEAVVIVVLVCLDEPGKDHNLATLAAQAGYSPFHFHRIFRAMTGESPSAFLRRIRLEWSAKQLIEGTSVSKVAAESGFGSLDSFTRAFRLAYGERPSAFRRSPCHILLACPNGVHYGHPFTIDFQTYRGRQMNIRIEQSQELHVIGMRHIGPYPTIGSTFGKLMGWVAQNPTEFIGSVATFLDDPEQVPAEELRSDALLIVPQPVEAPEGLVCYTIPSTKVLVAEYTGDYSGLSNAWMKVFAEELPPRNLQTAEGYMYERYLSDMSTTPPAELRTDIYVPVQ